MGRMRSAASGVDNSVKEIEVMGPHRFFHNDFTEIYKDWIISYLTPGGNHHVDNGVPTFESPMLLQAAGNLQHNLTPEQLQGARILVVNVWRPIDMTGKDQPLERCPLAICDR